MVGTLAHVTRWPRYKIIAAVIAVLYAAVALIFLREYFPWTSVNFILGAIGLPLTVAATPAANGSKRFLVISLVFVALYLFSHEKTILFIALAAAVICLIEMYWQQLSLLSLLTISFMSTTLQYLAGIFSFPLRLSLTSLAGKLLSLTGV